MNLVEARELCELISLDLKQSQFLLKPIANGEYVIVLKRGNFHCWGPDDWQRFRSALEEQRQRKARAGV